MKVRTVTHTHTDTHTLKHIRIFTFPVHFIVTKVFNPVLGSVLASNKFFPSPQASHYVTYAKGNLIEEIYMYKFDNAKLTNHFVY